MTPDQEREIIRLRSLNLSPKQIARKVALRPAEVTAVIQAQAQTLQVSRESGDNLAPLHHCLINESAVQSLLDRSSKKLGDRASGLSQVIVTRIERGNHLVSSYLVDYWCLGVKSTFGPRKIDIRKYDILVHQSAQKFNENFQEISLLQAQSIIFGAVDYADRLGLKPDPDFERSKIQLGKRSEQLIEIEFGKDGKPFYMSGPYDNPDKIIHALESSVGKGNYNFIMHADPSSLWLE
jgi:hypothetical protein